MYFFEIYRSFEGFFTLCSGHSPIIIYNYKFITIKVILKLVQTTLSSRQAVPLSSFHCHQSSETLTIRSFRHSRNNFLRPSLTRNVNIFPLFGVVYPLSFKVRTVGFYINSESVFLTVSPISNVAVAFFFNFLPWYQ